MDQFNIFGEQVRIESPEKEKCNCLDHNSDIVGFRGDVIIYRCHKCGDYYSNDKGKKKLEYEWSFKNLTRHEEVIREGRAEAL